jgi:hypothetical protein
MATVSADFAHGHLIPEHSHPEAQFLFASEGVMTLSTKQGVWVVPPLRAVWIPAETFHSVAMSGRVCMRTLYLDPRLVRSLPEKCFVMNVTSLLKELVLHACRVGRLHKRAAAERRLIEMIVDQLKVVESVPLQLPRPTDPRAQRVVERLIESPGDNKKLERLCRKETKMTFSRWRQQLRLLHAMQRLALGEKVTSAALDAGYNSTSAFISMFRKQLGTTPARYLEMGSR